MMRPDIAASRDPKDSHSLGREESARRSPFLFSITAALRISGINIGRNLMEVCVGVLVFRTTLA